MAGSFMIPHNIVFGEGAFSKLSELKGKKAMIVTGGSSMKKNGFIDKAIEELKKGGMTAEVFDGVEPNPSVNTVKKGAEAMLKFEPDWIVALGGGSSLDAAKVMWAFYEYPELKFEDILTPGTCPELRKKAKLICIPSTSGTASEITAFTVITDTDNHIKYPLVSEYFVPDIAIVDPLLPSKMPKHITANTGMDVLAHATEAIVSTAANDYTDALAIHAVKLVFEWLPVAYNEPDNMLAREKMHNASTMAGMAFTCASLGLIHSLAHKIGGEFGITHGLANAILLPYIVQFNSKATDKVAWIEKELGVKNFPEVFALKSNRDKVLGVSSHVQRCIVSMANFSVAISKASPKMQFTFLTGPKHKAYIAPEVNMGKAIADGSAMTAEMAKSLVNPDRLLSSIFVSYPEEIIGDKYLFMQSLYEAGAISPNTDCKPDIFKYFTEDELIGQWVMRNDKFYRSFGLSKEDGQLTAEIAKPIVKDIISKAEEAVRSDSDKALDMRFGHDTALLPLVGFLAIEGMEMPRVSETVHEYWNSSLYMSMASNLQMIFYKNKENRILVKLLYNEKERLIPAIKSYSGPYYEWDILLNYLHNLIK